MSASVKRVAFALVVVLLVAGCGQIEPTATPLPPTATQIAVAPSDTPLPATATPMPPTAVPTLALTDTPLPATPAPTDAPTPKPAAVPYEVIDSVPYVEGGDPAQTLSIYLPETESRKPLTLFVQGGASIPHFVKHFAGQGYMIVSFDSRDDSYQEEIQDAFCALAWTHANADAYGFAPDSIVTVGGSMWGGNAAILGLVDDPAPFLAECPHFWPESASVRGVVTLAGVFDYSEEADFFHGFINAISGFMGGTPEQVPDTWAEASAITWVEGDEPAFLLLHGTGDVNVDAHQSVKFASALENAGVEVELVLVSGTDHGGITRHRQAFDAVEAFLVQLSARTEAEASPTDSSQPTAVPATEPGATGDAWIKTYAADQDTVAGYVLPADDGGYFIVGTTNLQFEPEQQGDVYLLRTDAGGEILWEKTYGGEEYDGGQSIAAAGDGHLLIAGYTTSFGAQGLDAYLLKVDRDGSELWSRTYGGSLDEMTGAVGQTADGGYILGGIIVDPNDFVADPGAAGYGGLAGRSNLYLLKTDGEGNELWSRAYDSSLNTLASGGLQTADGGFLALATITYYPDPDDDILLMKLDRDGNETWSRTWEEDICNPYGLIQTSDGNYLITASYRPLEGAEDSKEDFLFIKVDPEGNEIWRSVFGDPDTIDYAVALAETADGGTIAVGERTRDRYTWDTDIVLVKIDEKGELLWEQSMTASHTMFSTILQHPDGGYVIVGSTFTDPVFNILVIKTDSEGNFGESP